MSKKVWGIAGLSGSGKSILVDLFVQKLGSELVVIRLEDLVNDLFRSGYEGHRQITNYFGEEYLKKGGELNVKKLWKFVYGDQHKLRILDFLLEPLILDKVQKIIDNETKILLVEGISFNLSGWDKIFDQKIWVGNTEQQILENLNKRIDLPVSAEKYLDIQKRLYGLKKPENYFLFNNSDYSQSEKTWSDLSNALDL